MRRTKCLTYGQVAVLAMYVKIRIMKGKNYLDKEYVGQFHPNIDEIRIYKWKAHELDTDYGRFVERAQFEDTLIHELIHAKYYYFYYYEDKDLFADEKLAEEETERTMKRYPNLYCHILKTFGLLLDKKE